MRMTERIASVDALRGLTMAAMLVVNDARCARLARSRGAPAVAWIATCLLGATGYAETLYAPIAAAAASVHGAAWMPSAAYAAVFAALVWLLIASIDKHGWKITI